MKFMKFLLLFFIVTVLNIISCSPADTDLDLNKDGEPIKFYSFSNPGKWKEQANDHQPEYSVETDKNNKLIKVFVPFEGTPAPIHYIEAIVLLDHNRNEINKVEFPLGNARAKTTFKLPKNYKSFVYIVSKCNLHDMWEKKVTWDE